MFYFVSNSIGLLLAFPLVFNGLVVFIKHYNDYTDLRWVQYQDLLGKLIPSLAYIATK